MQNFNCQSIQVILSWATMSAASTVMAKNNATGCSELVTWQIVLDKRVDMKFE
jgi:hypothetical protein